VLGWTIRRRTGEFICDDSDLRRSSCRTDRSGSQRIRTRGPITSGVGNTNNRLTRVAEGRSLLQHNGVIRSGGTFVSMSCGYSVVTRARCSHHCEARNFTIPEIRTHGYVDGDAGIATIALGHVSTSPLGELLPGVSVSVSLVRDIMRIVYHLNATVSGPAIRR